MSKSSSVYNYTTTNIWTTILSVKYVLKSATQKNPKDNLITSQINGQAISLWLGKYREIDELELFEFVKYFFIVIVVR